MIEGRLKLLARIPPVIRPPPPEKIIGNLPWVLGNKDLIEYIKVTTRVFLSLISCLSSLASVTTSHRSGRASRDGKGVSKFVQSKGDDRYNSCWYRIYNYGLY